MDKGQMPNSLDIMELCNFITIPYSGGVWLTILLLSQTYLLTHGFVLFGQHNQGKMPSCRGVEHHQHHSLLSVNGEATCFSGRLSVSRGEEKGENRWVRESLGDGVMLYVSWNWHVVSWSFLPGTLGHTSLRLLATNSYSDPLFCSHLTFRCRSLDSSLDKWLDMWILVDSSALQIIFYVNYSSHGSILASYTIQMNRHSILSMYLHQTYLCYLLLLVHAHCHSFLWSSWNSISGFIQVVGAGGHSAFSLHGCRWTFSLLPSVLS